MITINDITIPDDELHFTYIRASGPGGQHVNKSSTAVQLQFDIKRSPSLNPGVKNRLIKLAGKRVSSDGVLTLTAQNEAVSWGRRTPPPIETAFQRKEKEP